MNSWSRARKRVILFILFATFFFAIALPAYLFIYNAPTCYDGRLDGDETGVDCGGSCEILCPLDSLPILSKGDARILALKNSTFEIVGLFENPNINGEVKNARYTIKLFSSGNNIPVKTIEGETFVPKGQTFAIFEGPYFIDGGVIPTKASFEWQEESLRWANNTKPIPEIQLNSPIVSRENTTPRLEANAENLSFEDVHNVDLVALISDESGNIFAASKTFIENLPEGENRRVIFTWPLPFDKKVGDIDIFVRVFPDRSLIR